MRKKRKALGAKSLDEGYLKDALKYLQIAHENDPLDFDVMLKLGWTYNQLKDDREAIRWFDLAQRSPDPAIASEAAKAYRNLHPRPGAISHHRLGVSHVFNALARFVRLCANQDGVTMAALDRSSICIGAIYRRFDGRGERRESGSSISFGAQRHSGGGRGNVAVARRERLVRSRRDVALFTQRRPTRRARFPIIAAGFRSRKESAA